MPACARAAALAVACVLFCQAALGGSPAEFRMQWNSVDGGGGTSVSDDLSLTLRGTIGQHEPDGIALCSAESGVACLDPALRLTGGFWAAVPRVAPGASAACGDAADCIFIDGFEAGLVETGR